MAYHNSCRKTNTAWHCEIRQWSLRAESFMPGWHEIGHGVEVGLICHVIPFGYMIS